MPSTSLTVERASPLRWRKVSLAEGRWSGPGTLSLSLPICRAGAERWSEPESDGVLGNWTILNVMLYTDVRELCPSRGLTLQLPCSPPDTYADRQTDRQTNRHRSFHYSANSKYNLDYVRNPLKCTTSNDGNWTKKTKIYTKIYIFPGFGIWLCAKGEKVESL